MKGLDQLEATPEVLRLLVASLTEEEAAWKPAPDRFSVREALAHLAQAEDDCYGRRLRQWSEQERPDFRVAPDGDLPPAIGTAREELERFAARRKENLHWLQKRPEGTGQRTAVHEVQGQVTLEQQVAEWSAHDLGHIRQIAELLRAVKYFPRLGPWQRNYKLNP